MMKPLVLGITGASGAPYAVRLMEVLLAAGREVRLCISPAGAAVIEQELGRRVDLDAFDERDLLTESRNPRGALRGARGTLHYHHHRDLMSPIASGSFLTDGMVICPCSGGTLSAVAHASGGNLIQRAAEVQLKERRKLILVPRETPLSLPHIENLRLCALAGAVILPAAPGFYLRPESLSDVVDFIVARICDQLSVAHGLSSRWGQEQSPDNETPDGALSECKLSDAGLSAGRGS